MTRGNPSDLQPFDPEIDRTFHRLFRHSVHLDYPGHFVPFEHPKHSVIGEFEHSVVGDVIPLKIGDQVSLYGILSLSVN